MLSLSLSLSLSLPLSLFLSLALTLSQSLDVVSTRENSLSKARSDIRDTTPERVARTPLVRVGSFEKRRGFFFSRG